MSHKRSTSNKLSDYPINSTIYEKVANKDIANAVDWVPGITKFLCE